MKGTARWRKRFSIASFAGLWCLAAHGAPSLDEALEQAAHLVQVQSAATGDGDAEKAHEIPFFPSAANVRGWQGFVRVVNHADEDGTVTIRAFDDGGRDFGTLTLAIDAGQSVHFNSADLEAAVLILAKLVRWDGGWAV